METEVERNFETSPGQAAHYKRTWDVDPGALASEPAQLWGAPAPVLPAVGPMSGVKVTATSIPSFLGPSALAHDLG